MTPVTVVTEQTFREAVAGSRRRRRADDAAALRWEADRLEEARRYAGHEVRAELADTVTRLHDRARRLEAGSR
jgi:hypothetical protein